MIEYFVNAAVIGAIVGLVVMAFVCLEALYGDRSPREVVGYMALGFFGTVLAVPLAPLVFLLGLLYALIAAVKDDWKWYQR